MQQPHAQMCSYLGRSVRSATGPTLGRVEDLLADARTQAAQWMVIRLVGLRPRLRALPLVLVIETNQQLIAPVTRRTLREAPHISLRADLTAQEELKLRRYWVDH